MADKMPLSGYRVLDLSVAVAGPTCSMILGDLGAEIIHVESQTRPDGMRMVPLAGGGPLPDLDSSALYHAYNRNKKSILCNLLEPHGRDLIKQLVPYCDVFLENLRSPVMDEWGLGYEDIRRIKEDVIYVSLPAPGKTGPLADIGTYGLTLAAYTGMLSLLAYSDGQPMNDVGIADPTGGMAGALGTLIALYQRETSGEGQWVEVAQFEMMAAILGEPILDYTMNGRVASPDGNSHPMMAPYNCYPCKGWPAEDEWIAIAISSEGEWRKLCDLMGMPDWCMEDKFQDMFQRLEHRADLDSNLAEWTIQYPKYELMNLLQSNGIAATVVAKYVDRFTDSHWDTNGWWVQLDHPRFPGEFVPSPMITLSDTPAQVYRPAPLLGEHSDAVYKDLLGLTQEDIDRLREERIIY